MNQLFIAGNVAYPLAAADYMALANGAIGIFDKVGALVSTALSGKKDFVSIVLGRGTKQPLVINEVDLKTLSVVKGAYIAATTFASTMTIPAPTAGKEYGIIVIKKGTVFNERNTWTFLELAKTADTATTVANRIVKAIKANTAQDNTVIANDWFDSYLKVGFEPLVSLYYEHGLGFEAHQQNSLLELKDYYPSRLWVRDNQGFGYIAEYAGSLIDEIPALMDEAECVVPEFFANERFAYYIIANHLFGLITAIARTGWASEEQLLTQLVNRLMALEQRYPHRELFELLLRQDTLPFKGNLLTRMQGLDELTAPVETQSVYVNVPNPLQPIYSRQLNNGVHCA